MNDIVLDYLNYNTVQIVNLNLFDIQISKHTTKLDKPTSVVPKVIPWNPSKAI